MTTHFLGCQMTARDFRICRAMLETYAGPGLASLRLLRGKMGSGVVVLGSANDGDVALICGVTKDLAGSKVHAGKLIGAIAQELGGRGGGRPDLAEAGGKDAAKLSAALEKAYELVG